MKWNEIQISTKNRAFYTLVIWHKLIFFSNCKYLFINFTIHCLCMYILISNTINHLLFYTLKSDFDGVIWYFLGFKPDIFCAYVLNLEKKMGSKQTLVSKIRIEGADYKELLESCSWNNQALLYFHVRKRYMSCIRWLLAQATFSEPFLRPSRQEVSWGR